MPTLSQIAKCNLIPNLNIGSHCAIFLHVQRILNSAYVPAFHQLLCAMWISTSRSDEDWHHVSEMYMSTFEVFRASLEFFHFYLAFFDQKVTFF